jgi:hypothetical protein
MGLDVDMDVVFFSRAGKFLGFAKISPFLGQFLLDCKQSMEIVVDI